MSEDESAKRKIEPGRSPSPPIARAGSLQATPKPAVVKPRPPPPGPAQAPAPLRAPGASAISPRPPLVAGGLPEAPTSEPSVGGSTEVTGSMSRLALESTLADMVAWRRDAERKLAYLESELQLLRRGAASPLAPPKVDLERAPTGPLFPEFDPGKEHPAAPWSPPVVAPAPAVAPAVSPYVVESAAGAPTEAAAVVSIARRVEPRPQYDLEMKPGEYFDLPDELDGSKRKRLLVGLVMFVILAGMAALAITAVASQR